jgi:hypothetical protein
MNEILEKIEETIAIYEEEIVKMDEFIEFFPESEAMAMIRKEEFEGFIEVLKDIIEEFDD